MKLEQIEALLREENARFAYARVADIHFEPAFREACRQNSCGRYGKCWTCPPEVGEIETLIAEAKGYARVLVFQTISPLEDSFDIDGMEAAAKAHNRLTLRVREAAQSLKKALVLGAGSCGLCDACTKPAGQPCRFPHKAVTSLEAYGVAVYELSQTCGLQYINGQNTVTYFGAVFY